MISQLPRKPAPKRSISLQAHNGKLPSSEPVYSVASACKRLLVTLSAWDSASPTGSDSLNLLRDFDIILNAGETLWGTTCQDSVEEFASSNGSKLDELKRTFEALLRHQEPHAAARGARLVANLLADVWDNLRKMPGQQMGAVAVSAEHIEDALSQPQKVSTLFTQYGDRTRKLKLAVPLTYASLMASMCESFPEYSKALQATAAKNAVLAIYVQDKATCIFYELGNVGDLRDGDLVKLHVSATKENVPCACSEDLKSLLETLRGYIQRHGEDATDGNALLSAAPRPTDILREYKTELHSLRSSLAAIRQSFEEAQREAVSKLSVAQDALNNVKTICKAVSDSGRNNLLQEKSYVATRAADIKERLDQLKKVVDITRLDVTRRARPSEKHMEVLWNGLTDIQVDLQDLQGYMAKIRPSWKRTWETELHGIVKEQDFLKNTVNMVEQAQGVHQELKELLHTVQKVLDFLNGPRGKLRQQELDLDVIPPEEVHTVGMPSLLAEIRASARDDQSERRLRAVEAMLKIRHWEFRTVTLTDSELHAELKHAVQHFRLRGSGEVERIERERAKKNLELLKAYQIGVSRNHTDQPAY
ncbi:actin interacting protein 3-domain-containing protein [Gaertneriomyces semiglobifer]|nr:actin interacting protein 3-domain-containing protein [Gaertneriomyces semiglobifer]